MPVSRAYDRAGAVVTLVVTGAAWWLSARFPADAQVFPRMVLALLGVLSLLWLVRTFLPFGRPRAAAETAGEPTPFFDHFGYFAATILFVPTMALMLGYRRPLGLLMTTAIFVGGIWLVFVVLFERRLPAGEFPLWQFWT